MLRKTFEAEIKQVKDDVLVLGSMVEQAIIDSVEALKKRDVKASERLFDADKEINRRRFEIENRLMIMIATQQPMAHDLRELAAYLEITGELERMGDYAKGIGKVVMNMQDAPIPIPLGDLERMAELGVSMLHDALGAFLTENAQLAYQIPQRDDEVDELYNRVYHALVSAMIANPEIIDHANHLMWAAHNLERLADRVSNICERTVFIATGELLELEPTENEDEEE